MEKVSSCEKKLDSQQRVIFIEKDLVFKIYNFVTFENFFFMKMPFGHLVNEWKDTNASFSSGLLNRRCIFNLESIASEYRRVFLFLSKVVVSYRRTNILFVSGLPMFDNFENFFNIHQKKLPLLGHGYMIYWVSGLLTNMSNMISNFWGRASDIIVTFKKKIKRDWFLECSKSLRLFQIFPNFICFFSVAGVYQIALREAILLQLPVLAFVDSNCEIGNIPFFVVGNDDSSFGLEVKIFLFRELLLRSLKESLFSEIIEMLAHEKNLHQLIVHEYFEAFLKELSFSKLLKDSLINSSLIGKKQGLQDSLNKSVLVSFYQDLKTFFFKSYLKILNNFFLNFFFKRNLKKYNFFFLYRFLTDNFSTYNFRYFRNMYVFFSKKKQKKLSFFFFKPVIFNRFLFKKKTIKYIYKPFSLNKFLNKFLKKKKKKKNLIVFSLKNWVRFKNFNLSLSFLSDFNIFMNNGFFFLDTATCFFFNSFFLSNKVYYTLSCTFLDVIRFCFLDVYVSNVFFSLILKNRIFFNFYFLSGTVLIKNLFFEIFLKGLKLSFENGFIFLKEMTSDEEITFNSFFSLLSDFLFYKKKLQLFSFRIQKDELSFAQDIYNKKVKYLKYKYRMKRHEFLHSMKIKKRFLKVKKTQLESERLDSSKLLKEKQHLFFLRGMVDYKFSNLEHRRLFFSKNLLFVKLLLLKKKILNNHLRIKNYWLFYKFKFLKYNKLLFFFPKLTNLFLKKSSRRQRISRFSNLEDKKKENLQNLFSNQNSRILSNFYKNNLEFKGDLSLLVQQQKTLNSSFLFFKRKLRKKGFFRQKYTNFSTRLPNFFFNFKRQFEIEKKKDIVSFRNTFNSIFEKKRLSIKHFNKNLSNCFVGNSKKFLLENNFFKKNDLNLSYINNLFFYKKRIASGFYKNLFDVLLVFKFANFRSFWFDSKNNEKKFLLWFPKNNVNKKILFLVNNKELKKKNLKKKKILNLFFLNLLKQKKKILNLFSLFKLSFNSRWFFGFLCFILKKKHKKICFKKRLVFKTYFKSLGFSFFEFCLRFQKVVKLFYSFYLKKNKFKSKTRTFFPFFLKTRKYSTLFHSFCSKKKRQSLNRFFLINTLNKKRFLFKVLIKKKSKIFKNFWFKNKKSQTLINIGDFRKPFLNFYKSRFIYISDKKRIEIFFTKFQFFFKYFKNYNKFFLLKQKYYNKLSNLFKFLNFYLLLKFKKSNHKNCLILNRLDKYNTVSRSLHSEVKPNNDTILLNLRVNGYKKFFNFNESIFFFNKKKKNRFSFELNYIRFNKKKLKSINKTLVKNCRRNYFINYGRITNVFKHWSYTFKQSYKKHVFLMFPKQFSTLTSKNKQLNLSVFKFFGTVLNKKLKFLKEILESLGRSLLRYKFVFFIKKKLLICFFFFFKIFGLKKRTINTKKMYVEIFKHLKKKKDLVVNNVNNYFGWKDYFLAKKKVFVSSVKKKFWVLKKKQRLLKNLQTSFFVQSFSLLKYRQKPSYFFEFFLFYFKQKQALFKKFLNVKVLNYFQFFKQKLKFKKFFVLNKILYCYENLFLQLKKNLIDFSFSSLERTVKKKFVCYSKISFFYNILSYFFLLKKKLLLKFFFVTFLKANLFFFFFRHVLLFFKIKRLKKFFFLNNVTPFFKQFIKTAKRILIFKIYSFNRILSKYSSNFKVKTEKNLGYSQILILNVLLKLKKKIKKFRTIKKGLKFLGNCLEQAVDSFLVKILACKRVLVKTNVFRIFNKTQILLLEKIGVNKILFFKKFRQNVCFLKTLGFKIFGNFDFTFISLKLQNLKIFCNFLVVQQALNKLQTSWIWEVFEPCLFLNLNYFLQYELEKRRQFIGVGYDAPIDFMQKAKRDKRKRLLLHDDKKLHRLWAEGDVILMEKYGFYTKFSILVDELKENSFSALLFFLFYYYFEYNGLRDFYVCLLKTLVRLKKKILKYTLRWARFLLLSNKSKNIKKLLKKSFFVVRKFFKKFSNKINFFIFFKTNILKKINLFFKTNSMLFDIFLKCFSTNSLLLLENSVLFSVIFVKFDITSFYSVFYKSLKSSRYALSVMFEEYVRYKTRKVSYTLNCFENMISTIFSQLVYYYQTVNVIFFFKSKRLNFFIKKIDGTEKILDFSVTSKQNLVVSFVKQMLKSFFFFKIESLKFTINFFDFKSKIKKINSKFTLFYHHFLVFLFFSNQNKKKFMYSQNFMYFDFAEIEKEISEIGFNFVKFVINRAFSIAQNNLHCFDSNFLSNLLSQIPVVFNFLSLKTFDGVLNVKDDKISLFCYLRNFIVTLILNNPSYNEIKDFYFLEHQDISESVLQKLRLYQSFVIVDCGKKNLLYSVDLTDGFISNIIGYAQNASTELFRMKKRVKGTVRYYKKQKFACFDLVKLTLYFLDYVNTKFVKQSLNTLFMYEKNVKLQVLNFLSIALLEANDWLVNKIVFLNDKKIIVDKFRNNKFFFLNFEIFNFMTRFLKFENHFLKKKVTKCFGLALKLIKTISYFESFFFFKYSLESIEFPITVVFFSRLFFYCKASGLLKPWFFKFFFKFLIIEKYKFLEKYTYKFLKIYINQVIRAMSSNFFFKIIASVLNFSKFIFFNKKNKLNTISSLVSKISVTLEFFKKISLIIKSTLVSFLFKDNFTVFKENQTLGLLSLNKRVFFNHKHLKRFLFYIQLFLKANRNKTILLSKLKNKLLFNRYFLKKKIYIKNQKRISKESDLNIQSRTFFLMEVKSNLKSQVFLRKKFLASQNLKKACYKKISFLLFSVLNFFKSREFFYLKFGSTIQEKKKLFFSNQVFNLLKVF